MAKNYIKAFSQIRIKDVGLVGGKNASLGEMYSKLNKRGINIPDGFAITADAFKYFLQFNKINKQVIRIIRSINFAQINDLKNKAALVRQLILKSNFPADLAKEIINNYKKLGKWSLVTLLSLATATTLSCVKPNTINDIIYTQADKQNIEQVTQEKKLKEEEQKQKEIYDFFISRYNYPLILDNITKEDLESLYNDITSAKVEWKDELNDYLNIILYNDKYKSKDYIYDNNDKKFIQYFNDKDNQFRKLSANYFYPDLSKNINKLYDIDKDGIPNEQDKYPFNYSNGEVYILINVDNKITETDYILKNKLEDNLYYKPENTYLIKSVSMKQFESIIEDILSKTTGSDLFYILNNQSSDSNGNLIFKNEDGDTEYYNISRMNELFKGKDYAALIEIDEGEYAYKRQNLLDIDKSVIIAVQKKTPSSSLAASLFNWQIDQGNLNFQDYINLLDEINKKKFNDDKLGIIIRGEPNLPKNQEDWYFPIVYKK